MKMRIAILSLMTPALLAVPGIAEKAKADVRVKATIKTPAVRIHVTNRPSRHYVERRRPIRVATVYRVTGRDRVIARRLQTYSGVPARRMILMKRRGLNWFQIGNRLRIPQYVVRAAVHTRSWKRFMLAERRRGRCGTVTYHNERVVTSAFNDFFDDGEMGHFNLDDLEFTQGDFGDDD